LTELFGLLHFPNDIVFKNQIVMPMEEVLLKGLYELVGGKTKQKIGIVFGREWSAQARAFSWFINRVHD
jgi:hypothetical protein